MKRENKPRDARDGNGTGGVSRRSMLRKAAVATAAGVSAGAFSGSGAARRTSVDDVGSVAPTEVEASLETAGSDVLERLAGDGLLSEASAAELSTRGQVGIGAVAANREGTATVRNSRGVLQYVTVTHVDSGVLTVTVEPERDRSYAFLEPDDGDSRLLYDAERGLDGVDSADVGTTVHCSTSCDCTLILCDSDPGCVEECNTCCCEACCGCNCTTFYDCCHC